MISLDPRVQASLISLITFPIGFPTGFLWVPDGFPEGFPKGFLRAFYGFHAGPERSCPVQTGAGFP